MAILFIHEETQCISHRFRIVWVHIAVHEEYERGVSYLGGYSYLWNSFEGQKYDNDNSLKCSYGAWASTLSIDLKNLSRQEVIFYNLAHINNIYW